MTRRAGTLLHQIACRLGLHAVSDRRSNFDRKKNIGRYDVCVHCDRVWR